MVRSKRHTLGLWTLVASLAVGLGAAHPLPYPSPPSLFPIPADAGFLGAPVFYQAGHLSVGDTLVVSDTTFSPVGAYACQDLLASDPCGSVSSGEFALAFCSAVNIPSASSFDPTREVWIFLESPLTGAQVSPCGFSAPATTGVVSHFQGGNQAGACGYLSLLGAPSTQFFFGAGNVAMQDVHATLDPGALVLGATVLDWFPVAFGPTHAGGHGPWHAIFGGPPGDDPPQLTAAGTGTDWTIMVPNDDTYFVRVGADLDCDGDQIADSQTWVSWNQFH